MEEEFIRNQERLKPQEEKNEEERSKVDDLRGWLFMNKKVDFEQLQFVDFSIFSVKLSKLLFFRHFMVIKILLNMHKQ